jgi:hypothetical protein
MLQPGANFLTIPEAARRVGRSTTTIRRWITQRRLVAYLGMVEETALLTAERDARKARNTPRGVTAGHGASDTVRPNGG